MKTITRLNVHQTTGFGLVVFLGLVVSLVYPSPLVNSVVLLLSILAISGAMPTQYSNLRIALSFAFISIGLVLYLVIRGFFPQNPITNFDFVICIVSLMAIAALPAIRSTIGGVGTVPGHRALQVIPSVATSIAVLFVKPINAVLVVMYATRFAVAVVPYTEDMLMIRPHFLAFI